MSSRKWRIHPGNISSLQSACIAAIRREERIMDAILLQGDELGLPQHIVDELLQEDNVNNGDGSYINANDDNCDDADGTCSRRSAETPTANQQPAPSCPCRDSRCSAGFFPTSAVFINERQVVLLDGGSGCLKRCVVTFVGGDDSNDNGPESMPSSYAYASSSEQRNETRSESFHFSEIETIPEAFHRRWGGTFGSDRFVLKEDGAAVGVVSGDLCVFPLPEHYHCIPKNYAHVMGRTPLRFRSLFPKEKYASVYLPRIMQKDEGKKEERMLFVLAFRARKSSKSFDLRRIYLKTGFAVMVDEDLTGIYNDLGGMAHSIGPPRRTTTKVTGAWDNLPKDIQVESFLDLGNDSIMLLGSTKDPEPQCVMFRGRIGADERGAPTVEWSREALAEMRSDSEASYPSKWLCMSGIGAANDDPFYLSSDDGLTWSHAGSIRSELTGGRDGMPPVLAVSPSGRVFAFGYEAEECRAAETRRLMGTKKTIEWPMLRVYEWQ